MRGLDVIIPVADRHLDYAAGLEKELRAAEVRVRVDSRSERMNAKIRQAQLDKVPCMLIVGDREIENSAVSARLRGGAQVPALSVGDLKEAISRAVAERATDLALA